MAETILVVDDEPDLELLVRQKLRRRIRSGDYAFRFANDGVEALEVLAEDADIELVLTDINMPRMDGLSLLSRIADLDRLLKVVVVSAYGDIANIRTAMNRGAFDFVTKPIDFQDLEATIDKTRRELEALRQASVLEGRLDALHRELDIASQIQLSTLPSTFPPFPERDDVDVFATMLPAREVGGDFYDFFLLDDHRIGFSIGDVSGKGVGAALFMAVTRTMLRATALQGLAPADCVRHVNRVLHPESLPRMFVTVVYGVLDTRAHEVTYCAAGHGPPLLLRAGGDVTQLPRTRGLGLCLTDDFAYEEQTVPLAEGDTLLLYTDGITEATNGDRKQLGETSLEAALGCAAGQSSASAIRTVLHHVEQFTGGAPQADDMTLLALRVNAP